MTKHKSANEIIHWANGGEIERVYANGNVEVEKNPNWGDAGAHYRIKPQPKEKKYLYAYQRRWTVVFSKVKDGDEQFYLGRIEVQNDN